MRKSKQVFARLCGHPIKIRTKWKGKIHALCKKCMARHPLDIKKCEMCGSTLVFSAITQYLYARQRLALPTRCPGCKKDTQLFIRAIYMVTRRYRNSVVADYKKVSHLGFPTNQLVCVLRGRRDNELVAEVCIETQRNGERIPVVKYADR